MAKKAVVNKLEEAAQLEKDPKAAKAAKASVPPTGHLATDLGRAVAGMHAKLPPGSVGEAPPPVEAGAKPVVAPPPKAVVPVARPDTRVEEMSKRLNNFVTETKLDTLNEKFKGLEVLAAQVREDVAGDRGGQVDALRKRVEKLELPPSRVENWMGRKVVGGVTRGHATGTVAGAAAGAAGTWGVLRLATGAAHGGAVGVGAAMGGLFGMALGHLAGRS